ncbi:MAG: hypothetical protein EBY42_04390, partial [Actinobacteria bacterium]|nr:hypothetical protein [Actinomycetota bacterium]
MQKKQLMALGGAAVLLVAAVASIGTPAAQAAGVPVPCANSVSGVNVTEGDTVDLGIAGGCTLVSSSAAGNLEPLSSTSFLAFAAGSGSINALVVDANEVEYLNRVNVTIASKPAPPETPTPTPTPEQSTSQPTTTPSASDSASPTATPSATATVAPTANPTTSPTANPTAPYDLSDLRPSVVQSTAPDPDQGLKKSNITVATDAGPGNIIIESSNGNPLQLLDFTGLSDTPANYEDGNYLRSTANGVEYVHPTGIAKDIGDEIVDTIIKDQLLDFTGLSDTPQDYEDGSYLRSTADGVEYVAPTGI